jgi:hypothetical protein
MKSLADQFQIEPIACNNKRLKTHVAAAAAA